MEEGDVSPWVSLVQMGADGDRYYMYKGEAKRLFYMIDRDFSGRISERGEDVNVFDLTIAEFCEYWISTLR